MKPLGMKWYRFLCVIIPFGAFANACMPFSSTADYAKQTGISFMQYVMLSPAYMITYLASGLCVAAVLALLEYHLIHKTDMCPSLVRLYIAVCTASHAALIILGYPIIGAVDTSLLGALVAVYIFWVPTYFYLRARFGGLSSCSAPRKSAPPQRQETVFEVIPRKLQGVTDQKARDNIIAMTLCGQINPYNGHAMTSEAEWNSYVQSFSDERAQKKQSTVPPDETPSENPVSEVEDSSTPRPKFCRKCGKPLRPDSAFCEWCGENTK